MRVLTDEERKARAESRRAETEVEAKFKAELFKELGIETHPMRDRLYSIAWDCGHAYGLGEVKIYAQDLVELIGPPLIAVDQHEAVLLMASIEHKEEQIIRLIDETNPVDHVGVVEGLNREYAELENLHKRLKQASDILILRKV